MSDNAENVNVLAPNTIVFCKRPWRFPSLVMGLLVLLTFVWGFYILDTYHDDDYFGDYDQLSISEFLFREVAAPDMNRVAALVSPGVVGIGAPGVNAGAITSGAIVGAAGYVLTTAHGIAGLTDISVHVRTPTGVRRYDAEVVKSLASHDLVLLKMLTPDRFVFFTLADTRSMASGEPLFAFGFGSSGYPVFRQGTVLGTGLAVDVGGAALSHLIATDGIYSWEQNGGPLVNTRGELVALAIALANPGGSIEGYGVPAHVVVAHFQDVMDFSVGTVPGGAAAVPAAGTLPVPGFGAGQALTGGSAAWWAQARAQVMRDDPAVAVNAVGAAPQAQAVNPAPVVADTEHLGVSRIGGYRLGDIVGLAVLSLAAGIIGGMMTMGGGIIQVAGMMVIFGYGMYLIRPVAYLTNIFVYGAAALRNDRAGLIMWDRVKALIPWAVLGVVAGYFIGNAVADDTTAMLLGVFATLTAGKGLQEILSAQPDGILLRVDGTMEKDSASDDELLDTLIENERGRGRESGGIAKHVRSAGLGVPMGLVSGLLGISGGVVEVPLQRLIGRVPLQNAIANSSVVVFWASLGGTVVAFAHGVSTGLIEWQTPVTLALIMIPGAYLGGFLGAKLMKLLPVVALRWFYTVVMAVIAVKMLFLA